MKNMKHAVIAAAVLALPAIASAQSPMPVGSLSVSPAKTIAEVDVDKVKGTPSRLSWSDDGKQLYLQTLEGRFGQQDAKLRHYVIDAGSGAMKDVSSEPAWASAYWLKKSAQASPDASMKIGLETGTRTERAAGVAMGGDLARGGTGGGGDIGGGAGGTSVGDAINAAAASQTVTVHTMKLGSQAIGEFVNAVIVPGYTFGWGPGGSKVVAFSAVKGGGIVIMDAAGKKQEIDGTKDTLLPAWSHDGARLAWLRRDGRKKYHLQIVDVAAR